MTLFRSLLFWLHLATGVLAGVVILVMSVTGVALTYEKQMLEWADRPVRTTPGGAEGTPLAPEALVAAALAARPSGAVTTMTRRAAPGTPVTVSFGNGSALLLEQVGGAVLGEPSPRLRAFFRTMTAWHRWLALEGTGRATGRSVTGAANLAFLGIVVSGLYLWVPRIWTRRQVAQVAWFRRGLTGKARDFNWHNVIGIWAAVPLLVVVVGAVPISYPWASNAVYRLAGDVPPAPGGGPAQGRAEPRGTTPGAPSFAGLDAAWSTAQTAVTPWRAMTVRLGGASDAPFVFTVDEGNAGQPQLRHTITVDRRSGAIVAHERFGDLSAGRRLRSWLRFAHTGEYYGVAGQTAAGLASAGGAVLVYTGIALACRRWFAWMRRRAATTADVPAVTARRASS